MSIPAFPKAVAEPLSRDIARDDDFHKHQWTRLQHDRPAWAAYVTARIQELFEPSVASDVLTLVVEASLVQEKLDFNARMAETVGIPEAYATRKGLCLKKPPMVRAALERDLDEREMRQLHKLIGELSARMESSKSLLGLEDLE